MQQGRQRIILKPVLQLFLLVSIVISSNLLAVTFTVNSELDLPIANSFDGVCETVTGNGVCTFRAALQQSAWLVGKDTIKLPSGIYKSNNLALGGFVIEGSLDLVGIDSNPATTIIDGMTRNTALLFYQLRTGRAFNVTISGITIQNGRAEDTLLGSNGRGGGLSIFNIDSLTLSNVIVKDNKSNVDGAGISIRCKTCTALITDSIIDNNTPTDVAMALNAGGGLFFNSDDISSTLNISNTSIRNNIASNGGGLFVGTGTTTLLNSAVNNNSAKRDSINLNSLSSGGGLSLGNSAMVNVVNTTISGNSSGRESGGINVLPGTRLALYNATISNNLAATWGGGVSAAGLLNSSGFSMVNSIIAGNRDLTAAPDCYLKNGVSIRSNGYNIIGDATGCAVIALASDMMGSATKKVDPGLFGLALNGGTTGNHALRPGSPAIDAGDPNGCVDQTGANLKTDQRGFVGETAHERGRDGGIGSARCDIGAVELNSIEPVANAGENLHVLVGSQVTLDASASLVSTGAASYLWQQISGTTVVLSDIAVVKPRFIAPSSADDLAFKLTVTDSIGLQSTASVRITVYEMLVTTEPGKPVTTTIKQAGAENNNKDSSGGCSVSKNADFDPLFIFLLLLTLLQLLRSRVKQG